MNICRVGLTFFISIFISSSLLEVVASALEDSASKIIRLEKLISETPNNSLAYMELGETYYELKRYQEAINAYNKAVQLNPNNSSNYHNLSLAYSGQKKYLEAIRHSKEALRLSPYDSQVHFFLGFLYNKTSDYFKAVASLQEAIKLNPHEVETHYQLGEAFTGLNEREKAIAAFKEAIRVQPDHINSMLELGILYQHQKSYEEAIAQYEKAAQIEPNNWEPYSNLGMVYGAKLNYPKAIEYFNISIEKGSPDNKTYYLLGLLYQEVKNFKDSIPPFKKAIEIDPNDATTTWSLAESYARTRDLQTAYKYANRAKQIFQKQGNNEKVEKVTRYLALIQEEVESQGDKIIETNEDPSLSAKQDSQQQPQARSPSSTASSTPKLPTDIESLKALLKKDPNNANAYYDLATAYSKLKDFENAMKVYRKAIEIFPSDGRLYANLGSFYEREGKYQEAFQLLQKAEKLFKSQNDENSLEQIEGILLSLKEKVSQIEETKKTASTVAASLKSLKEEVVQLDKSSNPPLDLKNLPTDIASLEKLAEEQPNNPTIMDALGRAYFQKGKSLKALKIFKALLDSDPDSFNSNYMLGYIYGNLENYEAAVTYLEKAATLNPSFARGHSLLGEVYTHTKQFQKAIASYENAVQIEPQNYEYNFHLGNALQINGNYLEAIKAFNKAVAIDSSSIDARHRIAANYFYLKDLDNAILTYKEVVEKFPDNGKAYANLGDLYQNNNDNKKALEQYEKAANLFRAQKDEKSLSTIEEKINSSKEKIAELKGGDNKNFDFSIESRNSTNTPAKATSLDMMMEEWKKLPADEKALLRIEKSNPTPVLYLKLGLLFLKRSESESERTFKKAIELEPQNPEIPFYAAYLFNKLKIHQKTISYAEKALSMDSNHKLSLLILAKLYKEQKNYKSAISYYKRLTEIIPNHVDYLGELGSLYADINEDEKAIEVFKKILSLKEDYAGLYLAFAVSYQKLGNTRESIKAMKSAIKNDPKFWNFQNFLGTLYEQIEDYENALKHKQKAKELFPENEDPNKLSKLDNAIKKIRAKLESQKTSSTNLSSPNSSNYNSYKDIKRIQAETKKLPEDIDDLKKMIEEQPNLLVYLKLGAIYIRSGNREAGIKAYESAIQLEPKNPNSHFYLGSLYLLNYLDYKKAKPYLEKAVELDPSHLMSIEMLASMHTVQENYLSAISYYEKASELKPEEPVYFESLGNLNRELKSYKKAIEYYEKGLQLEDQSHTLFANAAAVYSLLSNFKKAIELLKKAIALAPDTWLYHNLISISYKALDNFEDAFYHAQKTKELITDEESTETQRESVEENYNDLKKEAEKLGIKISPTPQPQSSSRISPSKEFKDFDSIQEEIKKLPEDIDALKKMIKDRPTITAYFKLGNLYTSQGNSSSAIKAFEDAIRLESGNPNTHLFLAMLYFYDDKHEKAKPYLEKAIELDPDHLYSNFFLGNILDKQGKYSEAIPYFEKIVELNPKDPDYYEELGGLYQKKEDYINAINTYEKALSLDDQFHSAYYQIAVCYSLLDNFPESISKIERAIKIAPDQWRYHYFFSTILKELKDFKKGLKYAKKAKDLFKGKGTPIEQTEIDVIYKFLKKEVDHLETTSQPSETSYVNTTTNKVTEGQKAYELGKSLAQIGKYEEAIKQLQEVFKTNPLKAEAFLELGKIFSKLGEFDDAIYAYERSLGISPQNAMAHYDLGGLYLLKALEEADYSGFGSQLNAFSSQDLLIEEIKKATEIDPSYLNIPLVAAVQYYFAEDIKNAIKELKKALNEEPNNLPAIYALTYIYFNKGNHLDAQTLLEHAISLNNKLIWPRYFLFVIALNQKQKEVADEHLKMAKSLLETNYQFANIKFMESLYKRVN